MSVPLAADLDRLLEQVLDVAGAYCDDGRIMSLLCSEDEGWVEHDAATGQYHLKG